MMLMIKVLDEEETKDRQKDKHIIIIRYNNTHILYFHKKIQTSKRTLLLKKS